MIDTQESITAKLCSFARAYHSNFGRQKIFDDYLAFDLMGREQYDEIGQLIEKNYEVSQLDEKSGFSGKTVYPVLNHYISPIPLSRIAFAEKELQRFKAIASLKGLQPNTISTRLRSMYSVVFGKDGSSRDFVKYLR
ncbi:MAG: hypothetical protein II711_03165, partial [Clostridia bacterium]|nr:hypothetical protein [Clostridia bacterium]